MDAPSRLLQLLAGNIFPMLAAVAGIVIAFLLWSRAPRPALLLLIASVLQLLLRITSGWYYFLYLPQFLQLHGASGLTTLNLVVGVAFSLLQAADYGLLVWAIAADRRPPAMPPAPPAG
ncbi:MAG: hypothetical protein ABI870_15340 [Rhodanobacter sp.]